MLINHRFKNQIEFHQETELVFLMLILKYGIFRPVKCFVPNFKNFFFILKFKQNREFWQKSYFLAKWKSLQNHFTFPLQYDLLPIFEQKNISLNISFSKDKKKIVFFCFLSSVFHLIMFYYRKHLFQINFAWTK